MSKSSSKPMQMTDGDQWRRNHRPSFYWQRTRWPIQCLWFLLPLLIIYELGTWMYVPAGHSTMPEIKAEALLRLVFSWAGAGGLLIPPFIVVACLLGWHVMRRDPWQPELKLYVLMLLESFVWASPLVMFSVVLFRGYSDGSSLVGLEELALVSATLPDWKSSLLISIGAGIYEELLFRLIGIALIHAVLRELLGFGKTVSAWGAILISAVVFALYHYTAEDLDRLFALDSFSMGFFMFASIAGIYFGAIFVLRGFGIVVMMHALYDIVVTTARYWSF